MTKKEDLLVISYNNKIKKKRKEATNNTSRPWNYNTTLPKKNTIRTHSFDIYNLSTEKNTETKTAKKR